MAFEQLQAADTLAPTPLQALFPIVPGGVHADLRRDSLAQAWTAYRDAWHSVEVGEFVARCRAEPHLLTHANETWPLGSGRGRRTIPLRPAT